MAFIAQLNDTPPCECPFSLEQLYLERIIKIPNPESFQRDTLSLMTLTKSTQYYNHPQHWHWALPDRIVGHAWTIIIGTHVQTTVAIDTFKQQRWQTRRDNSDDTYIQPVATIDTSSQQWWQSLTNNSHARHIQTKMTTDTARKQWQRHAKTTVTMETSTQQWW